MSIFSTLRFFILKKAKMQHKHVQRYMHKQRGCRERTQKCQKWFANFRSGDFSIEGTLCSRSAIDSDKIKT